MTDANTYGSSPMGAGAASRDGLTDAVDTVKAETAHFAAAAGAKAQEKVAEGQKALSGGVSQFADALRQAGDNLEGDQSVVAGLVKQAAESLESVSRFVAEKRPEDLLRSVRDFGRDNPGALIAASVLAGLALGRLSRASADHDHTQSRPMNAPAVQAAPEGLFGDDPMSPSVASQYEGLSHGESLSVLGEPGDAGGPDGFEAESRVGARTDQEG